MNVNVQTFIKKKKCVNDFIDRNLQSTYDSNV